MLRLNIVKNKKLMNEFELDLFMFHGIGKNVFGDAEIIKQENDYHWMVSYFYANLVKTSLYAEIL